MAFKCNVLYSLLGNITIHNSRLSMDDEDPLIKFIKLVNWIAGIRPIKQCQSSLTLPQPWIITCQGGCHDKKDMDRHGLLQAILP